jgi:uracil phosphoribosyltransferase
MLKILKNIVLQDRLTRIRNKNIENRDFKEGMLEMGRYIAYEFQSTMNIEEVNVETPMSAAKGIQIRETDDVVVMAILRAALPMADGVMSVFKKASFGVLGVWRESVPPYQAELGYIKIPEIENKTVLIVDPMLATGNTMTTTIQAILERGSPQRIALLNIIATEEGVEKVLENHSQVEIYTCSIENKLKNGYIVPGLGDAGNIAFGKPVD